MTFYDYYCTQKQIVEVHTYKFWGCLVSQCPLSIILLIGLSKFGENNKLVPKIHYIDCRYDKCYSLT